MTSTIKEWLTEGEKEERFLISDIAKHGCSGGIGGLRILKNDLVWFAVEVLAQELDAAAREEKLAVFDAGVANCS